MGVLWLGLRVRVFHVPKKIRAFAIPSSCIFKLFQSFNYEIGDCFYDEVITQKHAFMG
jgi:hypothetical protein